MPISFKMPKVVVPEGSGFKLLGRIRGGSGSLVTQSSLTGIACSIIDVRDTSTVVATPAVVVSSSIHDSLQTDANLWKVDSTGYNFEYDIGGSDLPDGARSYRIEFTFDPAAGSYFKVFYEARTVEAYAS